MWELESLLLLKCSKVTLKFNLENHNMQMVIKYFHGIHASLMLILFILLLGI